MPDPALIIPGTQATTLRDNLGTIVYNAVSVGVPLIPKSLGGYPRTQRVSQTVIWDRWIAPANYGICSTQRYA